jgi:hypothetical protein
MSGKSNVSHPQIVVGASGLNAPDLIALTHHIVEALRSDEAKKYVPNPDPPIDTLLQLAIALQQAQVQVGQRVAGSVEARDYALSVLEVALQQEGHTVQRAMNANPAMATQVAKACGMDRKKVGGNHHRQEWGVEQLPNSGSIKVTLPVPDGGKKGAHRIEASPDGGKTWPVDINTDQTRAILTNLTPGTMWSVRYNVTVKGLTSDWSQVLTILVK